MHKSSLHYYHLFWKSIPWLQEHQEQPNLVYIQPTNVYNKGAWANICQCLTQDLYTVELDIWYLWSQLTARINRFVVPSSFGPLEQVKYRSMVQEEGAIVVSPSIETQSLTPPGSKVKDGKLGIASFRRLTIAPGGDITRTFILATHMISSSQSPAHIFFFLKQENIVLSKVNPTCKEIEGPELFFNQNCRCWVTKKKKMCPVFRYLTNTGYLKRILLEWKK